MKTLNEVRQRPDDWLGTTLMDLQNHAQSVRPAEAAGMLVVHTQDGAIVEADPLAFFNAMAGVGTGTSGPARWG